MPISRDELDLLIAGAITQAAKAIEAVGRLRLTTTEAEKMGQAITTAMLLVAARAGNAAPPPPPAPGPRPRVFNPAQTQEVRIVTDEDIRKTLAGMSAEDLKKNRM